jgi:cysteine desulfurase / selenocysteine lyase
MKEYFFDVNNIKQDFPALKQKSHGKDLVFLDSAASAQKPKVVIDAISKASYLNYANIHRGVYSLSQVATDNYEEARLTVSKFINAKKSNEVIFTKGATESINLVANSLEEDFFKAGDEIILSEMEHHANIVPWVMLSEKRGVIIKVIPINDDGTLNMKVFSSLLSKRTKLVAITHCSNVLGTINPIQEIALMAKKSGALTLVDGAQSIVHDIIDVQELSCDFFVFSAHKLYGPTGVGVLYAKEALLESMSPYQGGGDMIKTVSFSKIEYNKIPHKFEAGTPNICGVLAFKSAIDYIQEIGITNIRHHEDKLLKYATDKLLEIKGLKILGEAPKKASVITFIIDGYHAEDLGLLMDISGVAVRTGQHCCHPLIERYHVTSTVRVSFAMYNTYEDVEKLIISIEKAMKMLG